MNSLLSVKNYGKLCQTELPQIAQKDLSFYELRNHPLERSRFPVVELAWREASSPMTARQPQASQLLMTAISAN